MPALLVALLVVVPLIEIYLLVQVGQVIGALWTVVLLVVMSVIGGLLLRREGARTWRAFRTALHGGRVPAKEVADGALVLFGGALMLTPGFATDLLGLACVLPGSRAVLRRLLTGVVARRLGGPGMAGAFAADRRSAGGRPRAARPGRGDVVEGTVVDRPVDGANDRPDDGAGEQRPDRR
ncbi:MAG TPA: FxsA family protein [Mycobacteriales bacterium]|nr:FxsA family protein [Mycobacteriales bacterium]